MLALEKELGRFLLLYDETFEDLTSNTAMLGVDSFPIETLAH